MDPGGRLKVYYVNPPLHHVMLIDLTVKLDLDISGYKWIKFQGCGLHLSSSFPMSQSKQSWQHWSQPHSMIKELGHEMIDNSIVAGQRLI